MTTSIYTRTQNFLNKAKLVHNNKYDYSLVEYINAHTKIKIICPIHGIFEQTPSNHSNGHSCNKCKNNNQSINQLSNIDHFLKKAKITHNDKYDYSLVEYETSRSIVDIICPEHGEFKQQINAHLSGQGCKKCSIINSNKKKRLSNDHFLKKAKITHNDKYDYSLVEYKGINIKVKIICSIHGEFLQTPSNHYSGSICRKCSLNNRLGIYNFTTLNRDSILSNKLSSLYLIQHDNLYKVGITTKDIFIRFNKDVNIISQINNIPLIESFTKEQEILSKYSNFKEKPKNWKYGGDTEFLNITNEQKNQILISYFYKYV